MSKGLCVGFGGGRGGLSACLAGRTRGNLGAGAGEVGDCLGLGDNAGFKMGLGDVCSENTELRKNKINEYFLTVPLDNQYVGETL